MELLVVNYQKGLFNYFLKNLSDRELSAELTQEVFLKVFTKLKTYDFHFKFSTWVYSLAHNLLVDFFLKKKNLTFTSFSNKEDSSPDFPELNTVTREDTLIQEETSEKVWNAVESLPETYRELLIMRYVNELKYEEIAQILGIPMGTLKNKIFRAKQKLVETVGEHDKT